MSVEHIFWNLSNWFDTPAKSQLPVAIERSLIMVAVTTIVATWVTIVAVWVMVASPDMSYWGKGRFATAML